MAYPETDQPTEAGEVPSESREAPFTYDLMAENLVGLFEGHPVGKKFLAERAEEIRSSFKGEWDASEPYRSRWADNWKILVGFLPKKQKPWADASNAHVPLMMEHITRTSLLISSEIFEGGDQWFEAVPIGDGSDAKTTAALLTKHGNWQLKEKVVGFSREMDRAIIGFTAIGDVSIDSYYDEELRSNVHETCTPDNFLTPYMLTTTAPDYSDCPWLVKIMRLYPHQLRKLRKKWANVDELLKTPAPNWDDDPAPVASTAANEAQRKRPDSTTSGRPYRLLRWRGWMEMPDPAGEDEKRESFMEVVLEPNGGQILSFKLHEKPNWQDQLRFEKQLMERDEYVAALAAASEAAAQRTQAQAALEEQIQMGAMTPDIAEAELAAIPIPPPPEKPSWLADTPEGEEGSVEPMPPRMEPIRLTHHVVAFEPLIGSLGFSPGWIQADLNRAINVLLAQTIDSATLHNAKGWFVAPGTDFKQKTLWSPGKFHYLENMPGTDIRQAMMPIESGPANPQLMEVAQLLMDRASAAINAHEVLTGEPGKSGEAAQALQTRVELATKPISVLGRRFLGLLEHVLKANAFLNSEFLPEEELFAVYEQELGAYAPLSISRATYQQDYRTRFKASLRFTTETQEVAEADDLFALFEKVEPLINDMPLVYGFVKNALLARNRRDLVKLLGPEPPAPTTTFGLPPPTQTATPPEGGPPGVPPPNGAPVQPPVAA